MVFISTQQRHSLTTSSSLNLSIHFSSSFTGQLPAGIINTLCLHLISVQILNQSYNINNIPSVRNTELEEEGPRWRHRKISWTHLFPWTYQTQRYTWIISLWERTEQLHELLSTTKNNRTISGWVGEVRQGLAENPTPGTETHNMEGTARQAPLAEGWGVKSPTSDILATGACTGEMSL